MASYCEPMDVDGEESDENTIHPNGDGSASSVLPEDLDVSELNMKLRLSCTPLPSAASERHTFTGSCKNLFPESGDSETLNSTVSSGDYNMTLTEFSMGDYNGNSLLSHNSTSSTIKSREDDQNKNETVLYQSSDDLAILRDCTINNNAINTIEPIDNSELLLIPSAPISITSGDKTPTREIPKNSTSPIMRGLKSVLSMFRQSQSPLTSEIDIMATNEDVNFVLDAVSPNSNNFNLSLSKSVKASTPVHVDEYADQISLKGSSPHIPESIVFNDDLINDLQWNDDTTITFNKNKLLGRKLYTPSMRESNSSFGSCSRDSIPSTEILRDEIDLAYSQDKIKESALISQVADTSVECMDISMNDSNLCCNEVSKSNNQKVVCQENTEQTGFKKKPDMDLKPAYKSDEISVQAPLQTVNEPEFEGTGNDNGNKSQLVSNATKLLDKIDDVADSTYPAKQCSHDDTFHCSNGNHNIEKEVINFDHHDMSLSENFTCPHDKSTSNIEPIINGKKLAASTTNTTNEINSQLVENKHETDNNSENIINSTANYDQVVSSKSLPVLSNIVSIRQNKDNDVTKESSLSAGFMPNVGKIFSEVIIDENKQPASINNTTNIYINEIHSHLEENEVETDNSENVLESIENDDKVVSIKSFPVLSNIFTINDSEDNIITKESSLSAGIMPNVGEHFSEGIVHENFQAASDSNRTENIVSIDRKIPVIVESKLSVVHSEGSMESTEKLNSLACCETILGLNNIAEINQQEHSMGTEESLLSSKVMNNAAEINSINGTSIINKQKEGVNIEEVDDTKKTDLKIFTENEIKMSRPNEKSCKKASNVGDDEEIVISENNSPYVSLNAPPEHESNDEIMITKDVEMDFDSLENPFITKSRVSVTPPPSENYHNEFENRCTTSERVGLSPLASYNFVQDLNLETPSKTHDGNCDTNKMKINIKIDRVDNNAVNSTLETKDCVENISSYIDLLPSILNDDTQNACSFDNLEIFIKKELKKPETSEKDAVKCDDIPSIIGNATTDVDINLLTGESDIVNNIDLQDYSDAYLSADSSGRESEHLLESELESIDRTCTIGILEHKYEENIVIVEAKCKNSIQTKSYTGIAHNFNDCDCDPFETKTKIPLSPSLTQKESIDFFKLPDHENNLTKIEFEPQPVMSQNLKEDSLSKTEVDSTKEKHSETKTNPEVSSIQAANPVVSREISLAQRDNPFTTTTKIEMSPSLLHNNDTYDIQELSQVEGKIRESLKSEVHSSSKVTNSLKSTISARDYTSEPSKTNIGVESKSGIVTTLSEEDNIKKATLVQYFNTFNIEDSHNSTQYDSTTKIEILQLAHPESSLISKRKDMISQPNTPNCIAECDNILDCMNPFVTKSKIRMSPPLSQEFNCISEQILTTNTSNNCSNNKHISQINSTFDMTENVPQANGDTNSDVDINIETENQEESAIQSPIKCYSGNDDTISSGNSILSGDTDHTTKEVKTEDEDTMEGPDFVGLDPHNADKKFEIEREITGPKVILCCDDPAMLLKEIEDVDQNFVDCTDEEFKPAELFINADTFDFLMNQNPANNRTNDNGKESLFLKFDPLCANKRNSAAGIVSKLDHNRGTSSSEVIDEETAFIGSVSMLTSEKKFQQINDQTQGNSNNDGGQYFVLECSTPPEKPVMAVMPAVNNDQTMTPRSATYTPTRSQRRSMTFSSPAIAAIDRLISLSGNNSPLNQTYTDNYVSSQESNDAIIELRELLAAKELQIEQLRTEARGYQERLTDLEIQMTSLQEVNNDRLVKLNALQAKLAQKTALNHNMAAVVEEYERVIAGMIGENEQEKQRHEQERVMLVRERDEQVAHLNSMEVSFSDLHTKYERTKQVISTYKANEDALRKTIEKYKENQQKLENHCETLKQQAMSKLNNINMELEKLKKGHESEVLKLTALVKRKEMHATSLEETLAQKVKANEELTAICDELISKVG